MSSVLKLALPQLAPIWLNRDKTVEKAIQAVDEAEGKCGECSN